MWDILCVAAQSLECLRSLLSGCHIGSCSCWVFVAAAQVEEVAGLPLAAVAVATVVGEGAGGRRWEQTVAVVVGVVSGLHTAWGIVGSDSDVQSHTEPIKIQNMRLRENEYYKKKVLNIFEIF